MEENLDERGEDFQRILIKSASLLAPYVDRPTAKERAKEQDDYDYAGPNVVISLGGILI